MLVILSLLVSLFTIIHAWKHLPIATAGKVVGCILLFLSGWVGALVYWIYFAIKRPSGDEKSQTTRAARKTTSYAAAIQEYDEISQQFEGEELVIKCLFAFIKFMLNPGISYDEKCRLIELNEEKIAQLSDTIRTKFYIEGVTRSFKAQEDMFKEMFGEVPMLISTEVDQFNAAVSSGRQLQPLSSYLEKIMIFSKLIDTPDKEITFDTKIFKKYQIPDWANVE